MKQPHTYRKIANLHRAYAAVEAAFGAALASTGLSSKAQWDVLRLLREQPGASGAAIARGIKVTPQAVATMLRRLEKAGLIDRHSPSHGRAMQIHLTSQGEALLRKGDQIADQIEAKILSAFSLEEQEQFNNHLLRCIASLDAGLE